MRVAVVGNGAMGKLLASKINSRDGMELSKVIDPLNGVTFDGLETDVVIDFSHPSNLEAMIDYAIKTNTSLVIATTGYSDEQINKIEEASNLIPVLFTANTSLGVNLLSSVLGMITPLLHEEYDIEVIEKHHNKKLDAPSGTAKYLVDSMNDSLSLSKNVVYGREGMQKREDNEIGVHAIRGGTIAGEHTVLFAGDDEIIEIKHTALSKNVFVNGALKAAVFMKNQHAGLYTMKDVLNLKGE